MFLEKLEIQGFKSFANKTSLEFKREMTAVVGPNGSGKSNIADAVRWVLGEQSMKLLRGKKSEDVIFSGSDKKTQLGMAEVSLYLNNEDRSAPIDYSEVVITRRIYRDGTGEYLINKNKVRLHDILLLLAKSHFGQRAYSVIGQGMIDAILVSSPA
ncbi:MAG: AAA family ATPase, partial [Patescibacteria group bacterium]